MSASSTTRRWITCLVLSCLLVGERAFAQLPSRSQPEDGIARWGMINAVGYGGLGFLAGLAVAWDDDIDGAVAKIGLSSLAGVVTGATIGGHASKRIRSGEPLSGTSRFAVSTGAILAGATLGACAAVPLINNEGSGTPLGSDESALAILMGTGTLLGAWYLRRNMGDFDGARLGIAPMRTRDSAYGLRVSVRY